MTMKGEETGEINSLKQEKWSRRQIIANAAMVGLTAALSGCASTRKQPVIAQRAGPSKTFVLVHGAWHGGWCWRDVRSQLEALGHRVFTPTLTGLAERAHLLSADVGLDTHITDITSLIDYYDLNDIVLVGHSYGGMVITGVADAMKDRIEAIIYLDAALPKNGETMISQGPERSPAVIAQIQTALSGLAPDGVGMAVFPSESLGIPKGHPSYDWVAQKLTPHPLKTWLDPITLENGGSSGLQRSYIHCTAPALPNSSFPYHAAQVETDQSWTYHALATGHDAMVTAPGEIVRILTTA
ncbi:alpha/beta fold hydrolase [Parasphingorhabdus cellanae]|uniref:Alpha/beta hydrolase n=1 Tax=Parasphingorhabdus cellanae TaxID=2806553 RepID=A0ABX7T2I4_9SPHN|nr:alpha/beta hydrolase [Parasphingorhabdus cellanae]QTD55173.1 alpha/beta hydrolase [Parasphingorhabdus cellanae]